MIKTYKEYDKDDEKNNEEIWDLVLSEEKNVSEDL